MGQSLSQNLEDDDEQYMHQESTKNISDEMKESKPSNFVHSQPNHSHKPDDWSAEFGSSKSIDMRQENRRRFNSNRTSNKFWKIKPGLNYQFKCLNVECIAYLEPISIRRESGFGVIEPYKDIENQFIKCPGCSAVCDLRAIAICRAMVCIEYKELNDNNVTMKELSVEGDDILKFGQLISKGLDGNVSVKQHRIEYEILKFTVKR